MNYILCQHKEKLTLLLGLEVNLINPPKREKIVLKLTKI